VLKNDMRKFQDKFSTESRNFWKYKILEIKLYWTASILYRPEVIE
jgi:hypothetical protein